MTRPTTTGKAQDLITFTRSTTGTALAKISYGEEVVTNGDFTGTGNVTNWTLEGTATNNNGVNKFDVTAGASTNVVASQTIALTIGKEYQLSFERLAGTINCSVSASGAGLPTSYSDVIGVETRTFIATASSASLLINSGSGSTTVILDNVSVKEVLYDQPDGTLQLFNHPINKPRIEYDASGNCLGLLVEEARTNIISNSEALLVSSNRAIAESSISPTGEQTAQTWRVNGSASASPYWYGSANIVSGATYTCSVFVRLPTSGPTVESRYVKLTSQTRMQVGEAVFDLQEGTVASSNMLSESITPVGNGWYRLSATNIATSSGASFSFILWPCINAAGDLYLISAGDDGKALLETFGMQTEAGSFPTSYIPTSGSAVTRAADVASLAVSEFGYNQDQGTVVVSGHYAGLSSKGTSGVFELNQAVTAPNGVELRLSGTNGSITGYDNNGIFVNGAGDVPVNSDFKIALGFVVGGTNAAASYNGSITNAYASVDVNTVASIELFKHDVDVGRILNGHIKSIQYYPLRLSNAQLQALTV